MNIKRPIRIRRILLLLCSLVAVLSASSASAVQDPYVQLIGCSNSRHIFSSYDYYSSRHVAVDTGQGGMTLSYWATEGSTAWTGNGGTAPGFDANYAAYGATAVWYPLCIRVGDYADNQTAYDDFTTFLTLLRQRTSAPLYVSAKIGEQPTCITDQAKQQYVVDQAVLEGLALRAPDIEPANAPTDDCHFDPIASTNVATTAVEFLDGPVPPPSIGSFNPASGQVGASVTITGTALSGPVTVKFNGTAASYTVDSESQITATVPAGATTGPISVTTLGGTATSTASFAVSYPAPSISSFAPASGPFGTLVTITGSAFTGSTIVTVNGTAATYSVDSDAQITATVPSGATTGPIAVTTPGGTATSSSSFTRTYAAPSISSFTPTKGPVGTLVTINGSGFDGATAVKFNGTAAGYSVVSDTQITATVPSAAKTGKISVTTPGGTATSATSFQVTKK